MVSPSRSVPAGSPRRAGLRCSVNSLRQRAGSKGRVEPFFGQHLLDLAADLEVHPRPRSECGRGPAAGPRSSGSALGEGVEHDGLVPRFRKLRPKTFFISSRHGCACPGGALVLVQLLRVRRPIRLLRRSGAPDVGRHNEHVFLKSTTRPARPSGAHPPSPAGGY